MTEDIWQLSTTNSWIEEFDRLEWTYYRGNIVSVEEEIFLGKTHLGWFFVTWKKSHLIKMTNGRWQRLWADKGNEHCRSWITKPNMEIVVLTETNKKGRKICIYYLMKYRKIKDRKRYTKNVNITLLTLEPYTWKLIIINQTPATILGIYTMSDAVKDQFFENVNDNINKMLKICCIDEETKRYNARTMSIIWERNNLWESWRRSSETY